MPHSPRLLEIMNLPFHAPIPEPLHGKCRALEEVLRLHGPAGIAYSGGTDSAWLARHVLAEGTFAFLVVTPFLSERERAYARQVADEIGLDLRQIELDPLSIPAVRDNPPLRCYFCKKEIMGRVLDQARRLGCKAVMDGSHAGDKEGHRPGRKALAELGILSPLADAGMDKADIRELSRLAGLPTWNKPSQSCLATRVPYGTPLTPALVHRIEKAESFLWSLGCRQVRVRLHGDLARIEVDDGSFSLFLGSGARAQLLRHFRGMGFAHISLDLAGYHSGSWDYTIR